MVFFLVFPQIQLQYPNQIGHMVKSGSNICELCKGVADMGGIGFLDLDTLPKTNDGNYYLPNGIILIKNV